MKLRRVELRDFWCGTWEVIGVELRNFLCGTEECVELKGFPCGTKGFWGLKRSGPFARN